MKYPEAGHVKTRLGKDIGFEKALRIYEYLLQTVIDRLVDNDLYKKWVFFSPSERYRDFKWIINNPDVCLLPQTDGDLGKIISTALIHVFSKVKGNIVIIGTDCIEISVEDISTAFNYLNSGSADIVLGPATDGGYYLLGMKKFIPDLFAEIDWSTAYVFDQTLARIKTTGLDFLILKTLRDIDTVDDLDTIFVNSVKDFRRDFRLT